MNSMNVPNEILTLLTKKYDVKNHTFQPIFNENNEIINIKIIEHFGVNRPTKSIILKIDDL